MFVEDLNPFFSLGRVVLGMEGREAPQSLGVSVSDTQPGEKRSRGRRISQNPAAEGYEARRDLMTDHQVCGTAKNECREVETLNSGLFLVIY